MLNDFQFTQVKSTFERKINTKKINVLFFLEPVIFRQSPTYLTAHFIWLEEFNLAVNRMGGKVALMSNPQVCNQWTHRNSNFNDFICYPFDGLSLLSEFNFSRFNYFSDLYGTGSVSNGLTQECSYIKSEFKPDLVIMTSQNSFVRKVFFDIPILNIEQSPLSRTGCEFHSMFDPTGHQTNSMLQKYSREIQSLELNDQQNGELLLLIQLLKNRIANFNQRTKDAVSEINKLKLQGRIALFVLQPPDWSTFEGSLGRNIAVENLICEWADSLPDGWIGVPTYHLDYQLNSEIESSLELSRSNLRFLPNGLSINTTEALLTVADAMVTISSTVAMTGLLFGKKVIIVGTSPLSSWCFSDVNYLTEAKPLSKRKIASTLAFLTNRYSLLHQDIQNDHHVLENIVSLMCNDQQPERWFLDLSDWTVDQAFKSLNIKRFETEGIEPSFKVVSFYTEHNEYKIHAENLITSLKKFKINHVVQCISLDAPWEHICSMKSKFILDQWKVSDIPIVWLDADATVESELNLFQNCKVDFGIHKWMGHEFASGTIFFGKSDAAQDLLERWVLRCDADPYTWDQIHLESAWCDVASKRELNTLWLPQSYCQIFDGPIDDQPVIKHWQASRVAKKAGRVTGLPKLNHTDDGIVARRLEDPWRNVECNYWIENGLQYLMSGLGSDGFKFCDLGLELTKTIEKYLPLLDIGCGLGRVATYFNPKDYIGVDINPDALLEARLRFPNHNFRISDLGLEYPNAPVALCLNVCLFVSDDYLELFIENILKDRKQVVIIEAMNRNLRSFANPFEFYRDSDEYINLLHKFGFLLSYKNFVNLNFKNDSFENNAYSKNVQLLHLSFIKID